MLPMGDALQVAARLRHSLEVMSLQVDDATVDFFGSCINLESSLDEFLDIVGPFVEETGVTDLEQVKERCAIGHAAFLRYDPIGGHLNAQQKENTHQKENVTRSRTNSQSQVVVEGLEKWLRDLRLEHYLTAANTWCREMGAADYTEIFEEVPAFCQALNMKALERKRINEYLKMLRANGGNASAVNRSYRPGMPPELEPGYGESKPSNMPSHATPASNYSNTSPSNPSGGAAASSASGATTASGSSSALHFDPHGRGVGPGGRMSPGGAVQHVHPNQIQNNPVVTADRSPGGTSVAANRRINPNASAATAIPPGYNQVPVVPNSGYPPNVQAPGTPQMMPTPGGAPHQNNPGTPSGGVSSSSAAAGDNPVFQPNQNPVLLANGRQSGAADAVSGQPTKILNDVTVQRTITPQNDGPRLCFGDAVEPYVQCEELGAGAMATVYRCYRKSRPDEHFAAKVISLKRLKLNHSGFSREYGKLQREAQILSTLRNKYITSLVDVIEQRDNLYLVMEIVPHGELFDRILDHDNAPYVARFSEPEARYVFVQIAAGLKYVHMKQIVHRDLKPENILVFRRYPLIRPEELASDPRWNVFVECDHATTARMMAYEIKLSDFGLAKLVADGYSIATTRTGTPQYWAPEVATSLGVHRTPVDGAAVQGYGFSADLWSLGVVLYVLLCGRYPFTGDARTMEQNQIRGYFEFPKKCGLSNEAKYLITGLIRKMPNARISLLNCLRCKWATKSMIHMKCAFYRPRVPISHWKNRNILLPLQYEKTTSYIMSAVFRSFPIGMDPNFVFLRSDAFPSPPPNEMTDEEIMRNVSALDHFKNQMIRFVNDNFLEDLLEYEIDSYGDRYFYFNFKYMTDKMLPGGGDVVGGSSVNVTSSAAKGGAAAPNASAIEAGQGAVAAVTDGGSNSISKHKLRTPGDPENKSDSEQVMVTADPPGEGMPSYERPEDPVAHEILYTVLRSCFPAKILELITLRVRDSVNPATGEPQNSCGMVLEQAGQIGLLVKGIEPDSPMRGKIWVGDLLLEVQGKPLTTTSIFQIYCLTGSCLLVQRGA